MNNEKDGNNLSKFLSEYQAKKHNNILSNDLCIDNATGDILGLNQKTGEWMPTGNCGLHFSKASGAENQTN